MSGDAELRRVSVELGHGVFSLSGHTDFNTIGHLLSAGKTGFVDHEEVTVDIEDADCANTAGLALLMEWHTWCQLANINLVYANPGEKLLELVSINDIAQVLTFHSK